MKKLFFRITIMLLWIVGPLVITLPYIVDWFDEIVTDFYPTSWKAFKKGEKV
jgi:hypothetical protein